MKKTDCKVLSDSARSLDSGKGLFISLANKHRLEVMYHMNNNYMVSLNLTLFYKIFFMNIYKIDKTFPSTQLSLYLLFAFIGLYKFFCHVSLRI